MATPANIISRGKSTSLQLVHYPSDPPGLSDFDQTITSTAKGNFLDGGTNNGDYTTFDYVDLRKSLRRQCARLVTVYVESTAGAELLLSVNPIEEISFPSFVDGSQIESLAEPENQGWPEEKLHRILVPAGEKVLYTINGPVTGFNIDYNGTDYVPGTPGIDRLIITCTQ